METVSVHGAPSEYILQEGILSQLEPKLIERGFQKVLFVHGKKSWEAAKPFLPRLKEIEYQDFSYLGECSLSEIKKLAEYAAEENFDAIIGVGGGKVLDLVKAASHMAHRHSVLIPTLASNCSPWTPISVIYDDLGTFIRYDIYPNSASLVLAEPAILLNAPLNMLIAGIGDTLAKWYEADVQMAGIENKPVPLRISYYSARQCKDLLFLHSTGAISAVKTGVMNDDFLKVVETIFVLGGMVGGFGDHYGRIAGAHSIHNGLTILEDTHHAFHGEKVAYGILVQLALEEKWDEIEELISFYRELGLPVSLRDLGVKELNEGLITSVAAKSTLPKESIHVMPIGEITETRVRKAIIQIENLTQNVRGPS